MNTYCFRAATLALFLFTSTAFAADPPAIRFPTAPVAPLIPQPMPSADAVGKLAGEQIYVIDSDVPLLIFASPEGFVTVTEDTGPIKIRGRFVDGNGKVESRTFKGKAVYTVEATHTGTVELIVVPVGATSTKDAIRKTIEVDAGKGPRPPPKPVDPVVPEPKPDGTSPFAEAGFRMLMIFDSSKTTRPAGEQSVINGSKAIRDYLDAKCVESPLNEIDDTGKRMREWRIWPANSDLANVRKVWKDAFAKKGGDDWILIGDGKTGYSGPLPKSESEALELLKKYGGK